MNWEIDDRFYFFAFLSPKNTERELVEEVKNFGRIRNRRIAGWTRYREAQRRTGEQTDVAVFVVLVAVVLDGRMMIPAANHDGLWTWLF